MYLRCLSYHVGPSTYGIKLSRSLMLCVLFIYVFHVCMNSIISIQNMHSIMSSILAAILSGPLCVKATSHDWTSNFIRCWTLHSEAHDSLFYYGCCEHTRDWYGSWQWRFPHNGLFMLLFCIYYNLCLAPCTFTVNKLLLLLTNNKGPNIEFCGTPFSISIRAEANSNLPSSKPNIIILSPSIYALPMAVIEYFTFSDHKCHITLSRHILNALQ